MRPPRELAEAKLVAANHPRAGRLLAQSVEGSAMSANTSPLPDIRLLDVPAAAEATGLSQGFIWDLVRKRALPSVKIGHLVRIRPSDLESFIAAQTRPAAARSKD